MLLFGYHEADITTRRLPLEGYEHRFEQGELPSGVLDRLSVRVCALSDGATLCILATLDLCLLDNTVANRMRQAVAQALGCGVDQILLSLSHTHSGPVTSDPWSQPGESGPKLPARYARLKEQYLDRVQSLLASAACEAKAHLAPCRLSVATAEVGISYNRRFVRPDGVVKNLFSLWEHPGSKPQGPVDNAVPVVLLERLLGDGRDGLFEPHGPSRIVLANVACHPVVLGKHSRVVSADYPGQMRMTLEEVMGPGSRALFLLGACGDTQPLMSTQENPLAVNIVGRAIAYGAAAALAGRKYVADVPCGSASTLVPDPSGIAEHVVVSVFRFGSLALVGIGAECFVQAGIEIRNRSPFALTCIATCTNGWAGYLAPREAVLQGGYEVAHASAVQRSSLLSQVVDSAVMLLGQLWAEGGEQEFLQK